MKFNIEVSEPLTDKDKEELMKDIETANWKYRKRFHNRNASEVLFDMSEKIKNSKNPVKRKLLKMIDNSLDKLRTNSSILYIQSLTAFDPFQSVEFNNNIVTIDVSDSYFLVPMKGQKTLIRRALKKAMRKNGFKVIKITEVKDNV